MRNDIKFGLTIGGLLVFILIIWVGVVNRGAKQSSNTNDVTLVDAGGGSGSSGAPAATPRPIPAPAPAKPVTPAPDSTTVTTPPEPIHTETGQTAPLTSTGAGLSVPGDSTASTAQHDWSKLLSDGQDSLPLTSPPAAPPSGSSPIVAASDTHVGPVDSSTDYPLVDHTPFTASPSTRPSGVRTHTIQQGETFSTIAAAVYGNARYYSRLIAANPNVNPNRLKIGQVIQIPDLTGNPTAAAAAPATPSATASAAPIDPTRSYRVAAGDTLEKISRKLYGRGTDWQKIYELNKDQIGPNPGRLTLNMVLRLPEPPTVATAN